MASARPTNATATKSSAVGSARSVAPRRSLLPLRRGLPGTATLALGTPPREAVLQLDTGSSTLLLADGACIGCRAQAADLHGGVAPYTPHASTSADLIPCAADARCQLPPGRSEACGAQDGCRAEQGCSNATGQCCTAVPAQGCFFSQRYLDKTAVAGALYQDVLHLQSRAWQSTTVTLGAVARSDGALFVPAGVDGILGLGYGWLGCHPTCVGSTLSRIFATMRSQPVFALCLQPTAAQSSWDIGWIDERKYDGQLRYLHILHQSYYMISAPLVIRVSGRVVPSVTKPSWGLTVFDSGTTQTLVPAGVMEVLRPELLADAPDFAANLFRSQQLCVQAPRNEIDDILRTGRCEAGQFPGIEMAFRDVRPLASAPAQREASNSNRSMVVR